MMYNTMWKGIFLCTILLVGDPFITLKAQTQNYTTVSDVEVAHTTTKTQVCVL